MAQFTNVFQNKDAFQSAPRYMTVGVIGTVLDLGLFTVLHILLGAPALASNTFSYSAGIVNNYVLHRRWTYADRPRREVADQFPQFVAASLSALLLNNLLVMLLAPALAGVTGDAGYAALLAKLGATVISMCWNFLVNNFWTFARERGEVGR